jgi:hypothetical protein
MNTNVIKNQTAVIEQAMAMDPVLINEDNEWVCYKNDDIRGNGDSPYEAMENFVDQLHQVIRKGNKK